MTDQYDNDREELHTIRALFEQAVEKNTLEDIASHFDPDFTVVSFTDKSFSDFASFNKQWKVSRHELIGSGSFTTKLTPEPSVFIDNIAVCKGHSDNKMIDSKGKLFEFTSNWTVIFRRAGGQWKILRSHSSLDPFRNPILIHHVKRKLLISSLGAFILGGITCSLAAYWILH